MYKDVLKNYSLSVDGRGYIGQMQNFQPPNLSLQSETPRLGGLDAPLHMELGMQVLEASFVLLQYSEEVLALFGVRQNQFVPFVARGHLESFDGTSKPVRISMSGKIMSVEESQWQGGQLSPLTFRIGIHTYRREVNGNVVHLIDVPNMVRIVDGVDVIEQQRGNLGA